MSDVCLELARLGTQHRAEALKRCPALQQSLCAPRSTHSYVRYNCQSVSSPTPHPYQAHSCMNRKEPHSPLAKQCESGFSHAANGTLQCCA